MTPEELDQRLDALYTSAQLASSEGLTDEAIRRCEEALSLLETYGEETEHHTFTDFMMLIGDVHWTGGDYEEAYQHYARVAGMDPDRRDARVAMGVALYHLCRFQASQSILELASLDDPEDPEVWYYLGLLALRRDQKAVAMNHFRHAHELQDNRFPLPVEISEDDVVELVDRMLGELPADMKKALGNVAIIVEPRPDEDLLFSNEPPMDPTLLGIFEGTPHGLQSSEIQIMPTRVVLFYENIALVAGDRETLEEELWITLKHEIGHYFGLNEDELAERGLD